jgi:SNF2 family DNA or RNA helicase
MEFKEEQGQAVAASAAALMTKLSQYANGAIYDDEHNVHTVSTAKLDKLAEIVEGASPVLVFYQYKHDVPRIMARLKDLRVATYEGEQQLTAWNQGKIDVLLAHPASTAYGLNMQQGGHYVVWFGTGWNLELYQQANARLHRQGQQHPVIVYHLICEGTVDELALAAIERKSSVQQALLDGLGELTKKYSYEQE